MVAYFALYRLLRRPEFIRTSNSWVVYALLFIFYGVAITLPVILFRSAYVFWVFRGKATDLSYE
jgi:cytochrome bd-type quinol oxidase subunit 2